MPRPRFARLDAEKQEAILEVAEQEFAEHGFDKASFNRIIAAAGVSKGAMYYYFDDKADLFATVLERVAGALFDALGELGEVSDPRSFWSAVEAMLTRAITWFATHPRAAVLARQLASAELAALPGLGPLYDAGDQLLEEMLRRGQAVGAVRDDLPLPLLARLLNRTGEVVDVYIARHYDELEGEEVARLHQQTMDLLERIAAPAEPSQAAQ